MIKILKDKKQLIIIISALIIMASFITIFIVLSKDKKNEIAIYVDNTILTNKKIKSYSVKANILGKVKNKNIDERYMIIENGSSKAKLNIINGGYSSEAYSDTDVFLYHLSYVDIIDTTEENVGNIKYIVKKFKINKKRANKMLKKFDITIENDGTGKVYINDSDRIYNVKYFLDDLYISVVYVNVIESK